MSSEPCPPAKRQRKRYQVLCLSCGKDFNDDYKTRHEELHHHGESVTVRPVGLQSIRNFFQGTDNVPKEHSTNLDEVGTSSGIATRVTPETSSEPSHDVMVVGDQENCEFKEPQSHNTMVVVTKETASAERPEIPWIACVGQLAHLIDFIEDCKDIHKKALSAEAVNPIALLTQIVDITSLIKDVSESLLKRTQQAAEELLEQGTISDSVEINAPVNPDPGMRGTIDSDNQRQYLLQLGPHQPKLAQFPVSPSIPKNKQCRFSAQWYEDYPHLEYSVEKDSGFCFVCCLFPDGVGREKAEDAWRTTGVNRWDKMKSVGTQKLGKLAQHFTSSSHKAALSDYAHFVSGPAGYVDLLLDKQKRESLIQEERNMSFNSQVITILLDVARTLGRQGLAFRGDGAEEGNFVQIVYLLARHCSVMKKWLDTKTFRPYHVTYLSAESQNELIDLLATEVRKEVVADIQQAEIFSVMADTTPDTSHNDKLSVNVRYVDNQGISKERLLQICDAQDKTGLGLAKSIAETLSSNELDIKKVVFQSYDFASSMSGVFNGAQQKLSEIAGREIPYVPCQAHRINTFVEHACSSSIVIASLFDVLQSLYVFFASSTKRYRPLLDKLEKIENSLQLRNLSKTRWTARSESIKAVSVSFELIIEGLKEISSSTKFDNKTKTKAYALHKKLLSFDIIVSLQFMKNIMYKLKKLTESLESPDLNIVDANSLIRSNVISLQAINENDSAMDNLIESAVIFAKSLGSDVEQEFEKTHRMRLTPRRYDENRETQAQLMIKPFYRQQFKQVLDTLISSLNDNLTACFKAIEPLSQILSAPLSRSSMTTKNAERLASLFPVFLDPDALQAELEILADNCSGLESASEVMKRSETYKGVLRLANRACRLACTSPVTVAASERTFSKLKIVKNFLRSTMSDHRLDSLILLACEKDIADKVNIAGIVKKWALLKNRRVNV